MTLKVLASLIFCVLTPKFKLEGTIIYALWSNVVIQKADIYTVFPAVPSMKALLKLICTLIYTVSHRNVIFFKMKPCSTNSFPTCVIKQRQLLYLPLTSVWVLLNASSKAHSMNISFSHVCWNLLAKYVLFYTPVEK